jgi:hypothetical protein
MVKICLGWALDTGTGVGRTATFRRITQPCFDRIKQCSDIDVRFVIRFDLALYISYGMPQINTYITEDLICD